MEKKQIGLHAGKVWRTLNENGRLSVFELCRKSDLTFEEVALALGWLARENKITVRKVNNMLFVHIAKNVEFSFG